MTQLIRLVESSLLPNNDGHVIDIFFYTFIMTMSVTFGKWE